ncbi:uncharacterized protein LOC125717645 isoform X2 [Brienomyrus brachyistius]|uniref:uncharacterized protein LOC125717645 isoform X2 n=1 Tax=Brienomyrus brachyistius TaxID=42636 RepID=UPI0020B4420C|nr:uncharacterized protein LOC125717645 isoform X2 [Brienomyrus brachyistius]
MYRYWDMRLSSYRKALTSAMLNTRPVNCIGNMFYKHSIDTDIENSFVFFRLPTEKDGFPKVKLDNSPSGHHVERKNYKPVSKCSKNRGLNGTYTIPKNVANVPGQTWESDNHILAYLDDMDFAIEKAKNDYSYYGRVCIDLQEFSHVLEIYGYPPMFNTDDLLDAFVDFREEGLTIKRVDNTHALGIFSSESAALRALSIRHPLLKIRKLSKGINKSRAKAVSCAEFIQSMREGPRKDTAGPEGQSC